MMITLISRNLNKFIMILFLTLSITFMLLPLIIILGSSFNADSIDFPPTNFTLDWYKKFFLGEAIFKRSLYTSLKLGIATSLSATLLALSASIALTRYNFKGRNAINYICTNSPLLVPGVLIGLALFNFYIMHGIRMSFYTLLIGHIVVTLPYPIRIICADLQAFNPYWEEAAIVAGATKFQSFFRVTMPIIKHSIFTGMLFAFIISWNSFPISVYLATSQDITFPVQMWGYLMFEFKPVLTAISTVIIIISGIFTLFLEKYVDVTRFYDAN